MNTDRKAFDLQMFGVTREELLDYAQNPVWDDPLQLCMSILSDAQRHIEIGQGEVARQYINRAKFLMDKVREKQFPRLKVGYHVLVDGRLGKIKDFADFRTLVEFSDQEAWVEDHRVRFISK